MAIAMRPSFALAASHSTTAAHLFALLACILVLVWALHYRGGVAIHTDNKDLIINAHPVIMVLGFIIVAGEGIMAYKLLLTRQVQKTIHLMLHMIALALGIFGVYVAFKYHKETQLSDMTSLHSWLGMVSICLFGIQWLFGFLYFWFPKAPAPTRAVLVPVHAAAGMAVFLTIICTAETGFAQSMPTDAGTLAESRVINFTGLFILLFAVAVCISTAIRRIPF
ncbi:putative ascorbate ferrireductase (transmembrane) [Dioscorea sansibarensis]